MADDKSKRGKADRIRISSGEPYEINYFAKKHGIDREDAEKIIKKHGLDRDAANKAAQRLKS